MSRNHAETRRSTTAWSTGWMLRGSSRRCAACWNSPRYFS